MNDIKKETKKENFYLDKDNIKYIENYMNQNSLKKSEAIRKIIKEHEEYSKLSHKDMYKEIAKNITENLRDEYGKEVKKSKQHSHNTDKNVQVLIEMFNCFMINNAKESDLIITTDVTKSEILEVSEKKIERRIYENMYKKYGSLD